MEEFDFEDVDFELNDEEFFTNDPNEAQNIFDDAFSQLLNGSATSSAEGVGEPPKKKRAPYRKKPPTQPATLDEFEEAFTALKSIQAAHEPLSTTALNAYLFYKRGMDTTKRTVERLTWPEHPQTFSSNLLLANHQNYSETDLSTDTHELDPISPFYIASDSETEDELITENEVNSSVAPVPLCEMDQNKNLHDALLRTCQSIHRQKLGKSANFSENDLPPLEIDPHLSHVIARRCSTLLLQIFSRALLTRRSAIKLLQQNGQSRNTDVDNVPVNWEDTREAARQLVGQVEIDHDLFLKFSARLTKTFIKK